MFKRLFSLMFMVLMAMSLTVGQAYSKSSSSSSSSGGRSMSSGFSSPRSSSSSSNSSSRRESNSSFGSFSNTRKAETPPSKNSGSSFSRNMDQSESQKRAVNNWDNRNQSTSSSREAENKNSYYGQRESEARAQRERDAEMQRENRRAREYAAQRERDAYYARQHTPQQPIVVQQSSGSGNGFFTGLLLGNIFSSHSHAQQPAVIVNQPAPNTPMTSNGGVSVMPTPSGQTQAQSDSTMPTPGASNGKGSVDIPSSNVYREPANVSSVNSSMPSVVAAPNVTSKTDVNKKEEQTTSFLSILFATLFTGGMLYLTYIKLIKPMFFSQPKEEKIKYKL